ncbi:hypothetical protein A3G63_03445 [Candidatus Kaiserbacteria bacterium RIFCSPLOWO2_12_FULL_52_8]|uniref:Transposase IS200-like domain-containing protein n=1 Tax=Candidatus Kaiserbacteria bacterium RIFCSPHIGHO2_01_FULL_53_31 TaxID=1798481 RepID=A0A1F6CI98_9BACT|nr:MAG: hypothetical protein A2678_02595 [Candidatus Kaiserbacteria bacterium RIFCSPHIGHO2_01_FULL_53_31]OGG92928.1 MAG: hypothetical protein A3G63_03445 [Candidatus Kaiserbacteria bacterium RIFCSPLOWO2_12_FULL_52_8]
MRKEPYGVGSFVHVIKRGTRGASIVRDNADKNRFLLMLAHFNDEYQPANWFRDVSDSRLKIFDRPETWPEQKKLVNIIAFCLLNNHFHLLLEEIRDGGISKFMQRVGIGMSYRFNLKYKERGSIFESAFRSKTIDSDDYLRHVIAYIQLKNTLDMYKGKVEGKDNFEKAFTWACQYEFSSLGDHVGAISRPIVESSFLNDLFSPKEFKEFGRDFMENRISREDKDNDIVRFE